MDSPSQSFRLAGDGLRVVQAATWSFPPDHPMQSTATELPNTALPERFIADKSSSIDGALTDNSSVQSPAHTDSQDKFSIKDTIPVQTVPPVTPKKQRKKAKKRKSSGSDDEYKASSSDKKRRAATAKFKRKNAACDDQTDYKPNRKFVPVYTLEDEIDDDPDICLDECTEEDEQDMIHCDGEACRIGGKWFHTLCVGFGKLLPSNIEEFEWYCPTCRVELEVGQDTDGLIYRTTLDEDDEKEPRRLRSSLLK